jgi:hypothetical protein
MHAHANATQQLHREHYGRQNQTGRTSEEFTRNSPGDKQVRRQQKDPNLAHGFKNKSALESQSAGETMGARHGGHKSIDRRLRE